MFRREFPKFFSSVVGTCQWPHVIVLLTSGQTLRLGGKLYVAGGYGPQALVATGESTEVPVFFHTWCGGTPGGGQPISIVL